MPFSFERKMLDKVRVYLTTQGGIYSGHVIQIKVYRSPIIVPITLDPWLGGYVNPQVGKLTA